MGGQKSGTEGLDVPKAIEFSMRAKRAASVTSSITAFLAGFLPRNETAEIEAEKAEGLSSDVQRVIDQNCRHEVSERLPTLECNRSFRPWGPRSAKTVNVHRGGGDRQAVHNDHTRRPDDPTARSWQP